MATIHSIRQTLLKKLFLNPHPQRRDSYQASRKVLFPNEERFVRFLNTDSEQEMAEFAKLILIDLIFSLSCPPPIRLLFNLLYSQDDLRVRRAEGYIPRDHFVHIVNLYLLGIYIFSYHDTVFRRCTAELLRHRRAHLGNIAHSRRYSPYEVFSIAWKQFSLYHDIGYPMEQIIPEEREKYSSRLTPFTQIVKSINEDLAIKSASKLIALKTLIAEDKYSTFEEMFLTYLTESDLAEDKSKRVMSDVNTEPSTEHSLLAWRSAVNLPNISSQKDLEAVLVALPNIPICAFLEGPDGVLEYSFFCPTEGSPFFHGHTKSLPTAVRKALAKRKTQTAWHMADALPVGYRWHYFALGATDEYHKLLNALLGDNCNLFDTLTSDIESKPAYRLLRTQGVDISERLSNCAYSLIIERHGSAQFAEDSTTPFTKLRGKFNALAKSREAVVAKLPNLLCQVILSSSTNALSRNKKKNFSLLEKEDGTELAKVFIAEVMDGKEGENVNNKLAQLIRKNIVEPLAIESAAITCIKFLRDKVDVSTVSSRHVGMDPLKSARIDSAFTLASTFSNSAISTDLDKRLLRRNLPPLAELMTHYLPSWVDRTQFPGDMTYCDHGLASSSVALTASQEYDACFKSIISEMGTDSRTMSSYATIAFGVICKEDAEFLHCDAEILQTLVSEAITLHNLYPSELKIRTAGDRSGGGG